MPLVSAFVPLQKFPIDFRAIQMKCPLKNEYGIALRPSLNENGIALRPSLNENGIALRPSLNENGLALSMMKFQTCMFVQ